MSTGGSVVFRPITEADAKQISDNEHSHIKGQDKDVSRHFVDVLGKIRSIVKHTLIAASVTDSQGAIIYGFRLQSLYQGLEDRFWRSRKNHKLEKLVDIVETGNQRARIAIDKIGRKLMDRIESVSVVSVPRTGRIWGATPVKREEPRTQSSGVHTRPEGCGWRGTEKWGVKKWGTLDIAGQM